jgi:DNA-binding transcriptional MocR family regulator
VNYIDPKGGLSFYLTLKEDFLINTKELFRRLKPQNVYITPGVMFFTGKGEGQDSFRIAFYQTDIEKIKKGMKIIKEELLSLKLQNQ